LSESGVFKL